MVSLRKMAECVGLSGRFSVVHDFLGYRTNFDDRKTSLLRQLQLLKNRYFNLNIIRTGFTVTPGAEREIDSAIQTTRNIYAAVNLGIGRILHYDISRDDAIGRDIITSDAEATLLTYEWTISNNSIDVFIVFMGWPSTTDSRLTTLGLSAVDGPCSKYGRSGSMSGTVVSINVGSTGPSTGQLLAHELGHYLGLPHVCNLASDPSASNPCLTGTCKPEHQSSLMFPCLGTTAVNISDGEFKNMNDHCFVNAGCAG
jgi:hypothetical protein